MRIDVPRAPLQLFVMATALLLLALNALFLSTGLVEPRNADALAPPSAASGADPATSTHTAALRDYRPERHVNQTPLPVAVRIPAIDVASDLVDLGKDEDDRIEAPEDWDRAGWWAGGTRPGAAGPAVILGHVDSRSGPAIFFRLDELEPGDEIHVDREDGSTVTYEVDRTEQHAKDDFPTDAVYLPTLRNELRLVTCGGPFDRIGGSYEDNVIVFASQVTGSDA